MGTEQDGNDKGQSKDAGAKASGDEAAAAQTAFKPLRGFAALDPARRREIAGQGGRAAHVAGRAHEFTPEEARLARSKRAGAVGVAGDEMPRVPEA